MRETHAPRRKANARARGGWLPALVLLALVGSQVQAPLQQASARDPEFGRGEALTGALGYLDALLRSDRIEVTAKIMAVVKTAFAEGATSKELLAFTKLFRKHATRWHDRNTIPDGAEAFLREMHELASAQLEAESDDVDLFRARAEMTLAVHLVREVAHGLIPYGESLAGVVAAFKDVAVRDPDSRRTVLLEAAVMIRKAGSHRDAELEPYQAEATKILDALAAEDPDSGAVRTERAGLMLIVLKHHIRAKKSGDAKKVAAAALELLAFPEGEYPSKHKTRAGMYNEILTTARDARVAPKTASLLTSTSTRGRFTVAQPIGCGWESGRAVHVFGDMRFSLGRTNPAGDDELVTVSAFRWNISYAGTGGDNSGGLADFISAELQVRMSKAKAKKVGKKGLPRWISKVEGLRISGLNRKRESETSWMWVTKSKKHQVTYLILATANGAVGKEPPSQLMSIIGSLVEPGR